MNLEIPLKFTTRSVVLPNRSLAFDIFLCFLGSSAKEPNQYPFGTSYDEIYADLTSKDKALYTKNGMLHIMERNRRIKVDSMPWFLIQ